MKRFFSLLAGILVLFFSITVSAQNITQKDNDSYPAFSLHTSLTSWLDYDAGIMLGINYRWSQKFSASFEPTWIFYNGLVTNPDEKISPSGIKIRSDLRYHFPQKTKKSLDTFIGPELHYKNTQTEKEDRFGINCQNGQCAYFQDAVYTEIKNEIGALIKAGLTAPLTFVNKNNRLCLELYAGFGIKQLKFRETDLPTGGSFINPPDRRLLRFDNTTDRNTYSLPMLPGGLKLILKL